MGEWIEQFIYDLIKFRGSKKIQELKESESYQCRNKIVQFADCDLSDNDIANLTLLGNILEGNISNEHKTIVTEIMLTISKLILSNEDRFRIVKRLAETRASDMVFNLCKKIIA